VDSKLEDWRFWTQCYYLLPLIYSI